KKSFDSKVSKMTNLLNLAGFYALKIALARCSEHKTINDGGNQIMKIKSFITAGAVLLSLFAVQSSRGADELAPDKEGFIRDWLLLAPIQLDADADGAKEIERNQIPDEGMLKPKAGDKVKVAGKEFTWKTVKANDYFLDLNMIVNQQ